MNSVSEELKNFLVAKIVEVVELRVYQAERHLIEKIVREEIQKFMQRFMFVVATPKDTSEST